MVNFGPIETVPERFQQRTLYRHNPSVTRMRTTADECAQLGRAIACKLSAAVGPVALYIPLRGVSAIATPGGVFADPDADRALIARLKADIGPRVDIHELDMDINDPRFGGAMADHLDRLICARRGVAR